MEQRHADFAPSGGSDLRKPRRKRRKARIGSKHSGAQNNTSDGGNVRNPAPGLHHSNSGISAAKREPQAAHRFARLEHAVHRDLSLWEVSDGWNRWLDTIWSGC